MISVLVRDWRRVILLCAFPAAVLGAAEAMAADFNDRGNIVIADQFNNRVIEIDPRTHAIVWQFGNGSDKPGPLLNTPGDGFNRLNGPYDAKVVGDFTGLTPPFDDD